MQAKVIVRSPSNQVVHLVDTSIDEESVEALVQSLKMAYGPGYKIDQEQVELARAAAQKN